VSLGEIYGVGNIDDNKRRSDVSDAVSSEKVRYNIRCGGGTKWMHQGGLGQGTRNGKSRSHLVRFPGIQLGEEMVPTFSVEFIHQKVPKVPTTHPPSCIFGE